MNEEMDQYGRERINNKKNLSGSLNNYDVGKITSLLIPGTNE